MNEPVKPAKPDRRGYVIALMAACGAGVILFIILAFGYQIWEILSTYYRMKSGG